MVAATNWWATVEPKIQAILSDYETARAAWETWRSSGNQSWGNLSIPLGQLGADARTIDGLTYGATSIESSELFDLVRTLYAVSPQFSSPSFLNIEDFNAVANAITNLERTAASTG